MTSQLTGFQAWEYQKLLFAKNTAKTRSESIPLEEGLAGWWLQAPPKPMHKWLGCSPHHASWVEKGLCMSGSG